MVADNGVALIAVFMKRLIRRGAPAACIGALLTLCAMAGPVAAQNRSLEDRYIATRNAALARFTLKAAPKLGDQIVQEEEKARSELERQMRAILGPVEIKGLGPSKLNLGSLYEGDMGFGTLDGLTFTSEDYKTAIVVTTRSLFMRWLRAHKAPKDDPLPQDPEKAFRIDTFYAMAMMTDSAILRFAEVPLGAAAAKPAYAMLDARSQDDTPYAANEVFVAAIKGDRVFVGHARIEPAMAVPACSAAREATMKKLEAESKAGADNDQAGRDRINALGGKAETDFLKCFAAAAPKQAAFADVVKRAQELYDRMPAE
jgi:hypothetical protein